MAAPAPDYRARNFSALEHAVGSSVDHPGLQEVLLGMLDALARMDLQALEGFFTEDIHFDLYGFAPFAGSWSGRQEVIATLHRNFSQVSEQRTHTDAIVMQGDNLMLVAREQGRFEETGEPYHARSMFWFAFTDGRISNVVEFVDFES